MPDELFKTRILALGVRDAEELEKKDKDYGSSWKKRGGVGAFMMLARKWDRIENLVTKARHAYDIFHTGVENTGDILDDIRDLRRYLLLVEDEIDRQRVEARPGIGARTRPTPSLVDHLAGYAEEPGPGYVSQDSPHKVGWVDHDGFGVPDSVSGTKVKIRRRDGRESKDYHKADWYPGWRWLGVNYDIIAYTIQDK